MRFGPAEICRQIVELHFEARESGWLFDDQLLVLKNGEREARCPLSVKSDVRLTQNGLDQEFVTEDLEALGRWGRVVLRPE